MNIDKMMCLLGFHDWVYVETTYEDEICRRLAIPLDRGSRTCNHCGKKQIEDKHCLGLNPPDYVITWYNAPKDDK